MAENVLFYLQFQDHDFPGLSGARIVRIATHPDAQGVSMAQFAEHVEGSNNIKRLNITNLPTSANINFSGVGAKENVQYLRIVPFKIVLGGGG